MEEALTRAGISFAEVAFVVATGYGRINVPFADRQVTEITCHAKGLSSLLPNARTVVDIGGQDSKGISVENGRVVDFVMNDKCAAGTGVFSRSSPKPSACDSRNSETSRPPRKSRR